MPEAGFSVVCVDGEDVHIAGKQSLGALPSTIVTDAMRDWVRWAADFALKHNEFFLGYRTVGPRLSVVWLHLLETKNGLQRVHVESVDCVGCGSRVDIANPVVPDLYFALPSKQTAEDRAWTQVEVSCPRCHKGLPRRAIWAELASKQPQPG
jgi:hypothetical protein